MSLYIGIASSKLPMSQSYKTHVAVFGWHLQHPSRCEKSPFSMRRYPLREILSLSVLVLHGARFGDPEAGEELGLSVPGHHRKLPISSEATRSICILTEHLWIAGEADFDQI